MEETPAPLAAALAAAVGQDRVLTRAIDRIAWASDASFYRLVPKAVVHARSADEVRRLFAVSRAHGVPLVFRGAGTSLSGQSVTDGVLVETARGFRGLTVEGDGARIRVQPGVIGAHANRALKPFGRKIGPDPASIATCTLGGIVANNASGMCCGVAQNAYHTLESLTFLLPYGTAIDTASPEADNVLRAKEPALWQGLADLRARVVSDAALAARIRAKYRTKNTTGYALNAFLDFERPVDVFARLLVGSEGTLAFLSEAVLATVPDLPVKVTGLLLFPDLHAACAAIVPLNAAGAKALEVMDRAALRSVENEPGVPAALRTLPPGAAGLLAEFQAAREDEREKLGRAANAAAAGLTLVEPARFTHDAAEQARLWRVRQGMFPSVGAVRKSGTTVIIEDVAFPVERLADAATDLTALFAKHGYADAIIFGHARDGNLHFVLSQSFRDARAVAQYARLMEDVVRLVVERYDGALKAEHGTGRNMAPFVETEWGPDAYAVMKRVKELADPSGLLNPGVLLNADPRAHLKDLKPIPSVEDEVDRCIECGFCEPLCPSRDLTLTPRQRIVVRRELARLDDTRGDPDLRASLEADFPYDALDTCAVDGLCATACPVKIDTGQLTKRFRAARHPAAARTAAALVARAFRLVEPALRMGLRMGHAVQSLLGARAMTGLTRALRAVAGGSFPLWSAEMPRAASVMRARTSAAGAQAIYFPSCISRTMGPEAGDDTPPLVDTVVALAARAGVAVHVPPDAAGTCCGVPFSSKGYAEAHALAANRAIANFWRWSDAGRLPVFVDTSPCTYGLLHSREALTEENRKRFDALTILDGVAFVHDVLLPKLTVTRREPSAVLHPVCSLVKMGLVPKLEAVARACAEEAVVPKDAGCCGFAGDRGFLVPELTASATRLEAAEVKEGARAAGHWSSSRTCEAGLSRATGERYRSFVHLVERATRPGLS
ncbi:MAG: FAD-binding oxidoreductase [Acidobacteria bacterium]|nr:FAD-binding oxidoreductase [Acidobacteriota bacterium]